MLLYHCPSLEGCEALEAPAWSVKGPLPHRTAAPGRLTTPFLWQPQHPLDSGQDCPLVQIPPPYTPPHSLTGPCLRVSQSGALPAASHAAVAMGSFSFVCKTCRPSP